MSFDASCIISFWQLSLICFPWPSTGFGVRDIAFTDKVVGMKELFEMFNKITSLSILLTTLVRFDFSPSFTDEGHPGVWETISVLLRRTLTKKGNN